ncbi:MAG: acetyl-CoA C-acyltransferase, partial [Oleispira sp.]
MTTEAYIFDAIRTPRGRGKASGALHEVKPITLLSDLLVSLQERNQFDTAAVDDIVIGCVTAVGDQGAVIAKTAALAAGWNDDVAGVVLNRFCASGLEAVNTAAMKVRSGWEHLVVAGGVESMSRVPMGSDGGAWAMDPETNVATGFMPQGIGADLIGTLGGYSREDVDAFAMRSHHKAAAAWKKDAFKKSIIPVKDRNGLILLEHDELIRAESSVETLGKLKPSFKMMGDMGFDNVAKERYPQVEFINHIHSPGNSSGIV